MRLKRLTRELHCKAVSELLNGNGTTEEDTNSFLVATVQHLYDGGATLEKLTSIDDAGCGF